MNTILSRICALFLGLATVAQLHAAGAPLGKTQQLTSPDQVPDGLAKSDWTSIRAAYEAGRHSFQPVEGGWQARNPGQQWTTKFDGRGFVAQPRGAEWQWGLELKSYGFAGHERAVGGADRKPGVKAGGQRLTYSWDAIVQEWFVNDARGLEHGFTVKERPAGAAEAPLQFDLAVRGTLVARVAADGLGVEFCDASGATVLNYTGLKVWDADGKILTSRFVAVDASVRLLVDERGARYPLTIDPIAQQAYLKPAAVGTTQAGDGFGISVAVSGDTVVVGALYEDSSTTGVNSAPDELASSAGAAYVFARSGTSWTQQAYLKPAAVGTTQVSNWFGVSVAVSGETVVVGASSERSSTTGVNSTPDESASNAGAAYVFVRSGTTWTQQAYLKPAAVGTTQAGDNFGRSVAVSGDTVIVGAYLEDSSTTGVNSTPDESASNAGAAYVFVRSGTTWTQQAYLKPAAVGTTQAGDLFGRSVAVSGDTVVVGASWEDSSTTGVNSTPDELASQAGGAGAAYVFVRSGTSWTQQAYFKPAAVGTTQAGDEFGYSVAVSGDTVVVGALYEDSSTTGVNSTPDELASYAGAAYVFTGLGPIPTDIAVTQATPLTDGVGSVDFGAVLVGSSTALTFTISNAGTANLSLGAITTDGTNPGDFSVDTTGMLTTLISGSSTTFTVTFASTSAGPKVAALHIASNDTDQNPFDITLLGNASAQEVWRQTYFGSIENSGDGADLNDYEIDGLVNLIEFAFGLHPKQNSAGQLPEPLIIWPNYVVFFNQPGNVSGITYGAEWSPTLLPESWTPIPDTGAGLQHVFSVPIGSDPQIFMRLKVTSP